MPFDPADKERMRASTFETAVVLADDLEHIRAVLSKLDPTPGDIRRLSAQLRRMLVERDLVNVASPRIGRIFLTAPDLKPIYSSNRAAPISFFMAAGVEIFGVSVAACMVEKAGKPRTLLNYSPDATVSLRLDNFVNQNVICFEGEWVRRLDLIKYIANVAHGVHSGTIQDSVEGLIRRVRHVSGMSIKDNIPNLTCNVSAFSSVELPAIADRKYVDCVLIELFATASHVINSPDVSRLMEIIATEAT